MGYVLPPEPRATLATIASVYDVGGQFLRPPGSGLGAPIRLNLDRFGMPRDFATYMWCTYKRVVQDDSPTRRAFLR